MEPTVHIAAAIIAIGVATGAAAGCRLDPLVKDKPGASAHLLPPGSEVPNAADNPDLRVQINLNDGIDDATKGVIPLGTGMSAGVPVKFWSLGPATGAPSPIYEFVRPTGKAPPDDFELAGHPPLFDALPGDPGYSSVHGLNRVVVTDAWNGELITTMEALADAIDLGLVEEPLPLKKFVDSPVVLLGTTLQVGPTTEPVGPEDAFARGYRVGIFRFGGPLGIQPQPPGPVLLPTSQVSFVREQGKGTYDATRPIFQATIPTAPPSTVTTYTPLSVVVNVDLAPNISASTITQDSDLFVRSSTGAITGTNTTNVATFQVTSSLLLLQLQFAEGAP
jgi:hypothetical protein